MKNKKLTILLLSLILTGCKEKTFTVSFDTLGGNIINPITIKEGNIINNLEIPTKEGYLFVNWKKDGLDYDRKTPITEDITLTANWIEKPKIPNTYTVTFIAEDKMEKTVVKENEVVDEIAPPKKENYLFLGWYLDDQKYDFSNKITKDIRLEAKYELNVVTVTYELDGGMGLALETIPKNTTVSIPNPPQKPGYRFLKWQLNGKDFSFTTKIAKDITLKAIWEKIEYITISFDTDGGLPIETMIIEKYSKINNLPIPTKEGYRFLKWQIDNQDFNAETEIDTNIVLKAVYEQIQEN